MPDLLDSQKRDIERRLAELRPIVEEYARLEEAANALAAITPSSPSAAAGKPGRPPGTRAKASRRKGGRRGGRPRGTGTRAVEAHQIIKGQPGITIPELAIKMKIAPNYLYRVLPGLQNERKVTKQGKGWHATG
jgi:hypothetical protein